MRVAIPGSRRSSPCKILTAARRGSVVWCASKTVPIPPRPISLTSRYDPSTESVSSDGSSCDMDVRIADYMPRSICSTGARSRLPRRGMQRDRCGADMELARREHVLTIGSRVSAYQIERMIGSGGMGSVFAARHVLDGHIAALKIMREDQLRQNRAIDRMMREAAVLASVHHRGVPKFFECGTLADGRPWIAMELVDGQPLSKLFGTKLPHGIVMELVGQLADVLAAAH